MKKTDNSKFASKPLVYLDIDNCLIVDTARGPGWEGKNVSFNMTLISGLANRGVSEVTLVSSMKLKIPRTEFERQDWISRLDLIKKLSQHAITVNKIVSNYDVATNPETDVRYKLGEYYDKHIKPFEELVSNTPGTDLSINTEYTGQIDWQEKTRLSGFYTEDALAISTIEHPNRANIKYALFDRIFEELPADHREKQHLFIDDKDEYITAAGTMAEKHGLKNQLLTHKIDGNSYSFAQGFCGEALSDFFEECGLSKYPLTKVFVQSNRKDLLSPEEGICLKAHSMSVTVGEKVEKYNIPIQFLQFSPKDHIAVSRYNLFYRNEKILTDGSPTASNVLLMIIDASTENEALKTLADNLKSLKNLSLTLKIVAIGAEAKSFCNTVNTTATNMLLATAEKVEKIEDVYISKLRDGVYRDLAKTGIPAMNAQNETLSASGMALAKFDINNLCSKINEKLLQLSTVVNNTPNT